MDMVLNNEFKEVTNEDLLYIDGGAWNWKKFGKSVVSGAISGAFGGATTGTLPGVGVGAFAGAVGGAATYLANEIW